MRLTMRVECLDVRPVDVVSEIVRRRMNHYVVDPAIPDQILGVVGFPHELHVRVGGVREIALRLSWDVLEAETNKWWEFFKTGVIVEGDFHLAIRGTSDHEGKNFMLYGLTLEKGP